MRGGVSLRIAAIVSIADGRTKADWPVAISYNTQPSEKMSLAGSDGFASHLLRRHISKPFP